MPQTVWIVNPYGTLPGESWATYRSTMLAEALAANGYAVTQFISNFEHRSKTFRAASGRIAAASGYEIRIVPGSGYQSHVSLARLRHERTFARNLLTAVAGEPRPDILVLAEPALFYYDVLTPLLDGGTALVLDLIDIWPELFELVLPGPVRPLSGLILSPLFYWRRRLYRRARAVVAVARDYAALARRLTAGRPGVIVEVAYWGFDDSRPVEGTVSRAVQQVLDTKQSGDIWVVYAGTLGENYDIPSVLELARRAQGSERPRVTVLIAGDGPLRESCERSTSANCVFLGRLGAADLQALYARCDIALSTYKGASTVAMPIKAFDYLRYGLPIVNSLGRDLGALVDERRLGLNYTAGSAQSLHEAVMRLASDQGLRASCAANARSAAEEFRASRQYARFVEVLRRLGQAG